MPVIKRNILLNVPVEMMFRYLSDPFHLAEICSKTLEISDIQHHPPDNLKFAWMYKMIGVRSYGEAEVVATKHNEELNIHFRGSMRGTFMLCLHPADAGAHLALKLDYTIPPPLLKKHTEAAIIQHSERATDHIVVNLTTMLDAQYARTFNRV